MLYRQDLSLPVKKSRNRQIEPAIFFVTNIAASIYYFDGANAKLQMFTNAKTWAHNFRVSFVTLNYN